MRKKGLEGIINTLILVIMLVIVFVNVLSRYIFHLSFSFVEEIVCVLFVLLSTVGSADAAKDESHFTLDLLTGSVSPNHRNILQIVNNIINFLASIILCICGIFMVVSQFKMGSQSDALKFPEWIYGLTIPIGCGLMSIRFFQVILQKIRIFKKGEK